MWREPLAKLARWVPKAGWEYRVLWVLLALPVLLVCLAVWAQLDPSVRQALQGLLPH